MELVVDFALETDKRELYRVLKSRKPRRYRVTIVEARPNRTDRANRYYWGVVLKTIAEHTGFTADELHEYLKYRFLSQVKFFPQTGEEVKLPGSTADLNTKDFGDYLRDVMDWALNELDIYIPAPAETIIQSY